MWGCDDETKAVSQHLLHQHQHQQQHHHHLLLQQHQRRSPVIHKTSQAARKGRCANAGAPYALAASSLPPPLVSPLSLVRAVNANIATNIAANIVASQTFTPIAGLSAGKPLKQQDDRQPTNNNTIAATATATTVAGATTPGALDALATAATSLYKSTVAAATAAAASGTTNEMAGLMPPSIQAIVDKLGKCVLVVEFSTRGFLRMFTLP